jgi:DNA-binding SARP family transcriptional activator
MEQMLQPSGSLRLQLFGGPLLIAASGVVISPPTRKAGQVLAYLGLRPDRWTYRDEVMAAVWPDYAEDRARACLDTEVWRLRKVFRTVHAVQDGIESAQGKLRLSRDCGPSSDYAAFQGLHRQAMVQGASDREACLTQAVALQTCDLCPGDQSEWLLAERAVLRERRVHAMEQLVEIYQAGQRWKELRATCETLLAQDPLLEHVQRSLMIAFAETGERARALAQYQILRQRLVQDLQVDPMPETTALRDALLVRMKSSRTVNPIPLVAADDYTVASRLQTIAAELAALSATMANPEHP